MKLVKPRIFRESGRAAVRKLQYVRGKGIGKSESRRTKVKGKIQFVYNPADSGNATTRKSADFCRSSTLGKLKGVSATRQAPEAVMRKYSGQSQTPFPSEGAATVIMPCVARGEA